MLALIIPYYKLSFFESTLESIANQTDKRFFVYIGNDASQENPIVLLEKFKGKFDFKYHEFEENLGGKFLTKQWDRCIALSGEEEEWIMILGDDDVLGYNVVQEFYRNITEIKLVSNVVRFATCKINEKGDKTSSVYLHPKIEKAKDFLFRETRSSLSEYVFNKKKVNEIGFKYFPLGWFSDLLAVLEFSDFKNIFTINEAQVYIRITDISISGNQNNLKLKTRASFNFYYYLLTSKFHFFSKLEKNKLFFKINKCFINDKKNIVVFFKISKIYFINFLILEYLQFIQLIFLNSLKKIIKNESR